MGNKRSPDEGPSSRRRSFPGTSGPQAAGRTDDAAERSGTQPWPARIRAGRRTHQPILNDAQRGLATCYLPMAESLANGYKLQRRIERDELRATAYMALVEAARTFDPVRKVNFATFARHRIRGALRDYVRFLMSASWRGQSRPRPLFQSIGPESEETGRVIGISAERPVGSEIDSIEAVEQWLRLLPATHALTCRLIYIGGKEQDDVAKLLGYSKSHVSRIHAEALSWLIDDINARRAGTGRPRVEKRN